MNIDVGLIGSHSHVIIKTRKVDPRAEGGARILITESDRDVSSLEKSSTDNIIERMLMKLSQAYPFCELRVHHEVVYVLFSSRQFQFSGDHSH
jgi:hypothetical protein